MPKTPMTTILVTAAGAPGAAALLRGLRENGEREVRLVGVDMSERAIGYQHDADASPLLVLALEAYELVYAIGIRPVGFNGNRMEAFFYDQTLGNFCPEPIKLMCSVGGLAYQNKASPPIILSKGSKSVDSPVRRFAERRMELTR